ncbi:MAG: hypoxanthine phosphoribosyltransferase [Miltoncostaeaceae bacterium]|jgi:hypoxanthine phosphoribosyltransferase|nr:hypoxanthine phosphoribosyltransferase [Miltoncostaeaceae bacterium]
MGDAALSRPGAVLIPADRLQARVSELAGQVSEDYRGRELLVIGVLKGAVFFIADLVRQLSVPCELDFMAVSSYGSSTHSSGVVRILKDLDVAIAGRHVLLVEDIIDSGLTLAYLMKNLASREPASLEICSLLTKPRHRRLGLEIRYIGFDLPEVFAIGYGLDHQERFRQLPHIAALELDGGGDERVGGGRT